MTLTLPQLNYKARFLMIGYGLMLLIWMSLENRNMVIVALLGTGATVLYIGATLLTRLHGRTLSARVWIPALIVLGALIGGLSTITTALLMFFKTSWHAHLSPDFPPDMILAMLTRMPYWAVSGTLIGFCCSILITLTYKIK